MTAERIVSARRWPTNADLIADVARLYLASDMRALDPTYGRGRWWTLWSPRELVRTDLDPAKAPDGVADFTALPFADQSFDMVAFDPPYVATGGRSTQGVAGAQMSDAFGMASSRRTPAENQELIDAGLAEAWRVVRPSRRTAGRYASGIVLVKCQNYITSGRLWPGAFRTLSAAEALGFRPVDILEHLSASGGPQPSTNVNGTPRRQVHAKRNNTTLLVLEKGPRP